MIQTVILAGGLGTRLRELLNDLPKPMILIKGKPFLEFQINILKKSGIQDIIICIGYLGEIIRAHFLDGKKWNVSIHYAEESKLLGTAGALDNARKFLKDGPVLLLNGDTYIPTIDLKDLVLYHSKRTSEIDSAIGTLVTVTDLATHKFGNVGVDPKTRTVTKFQEKKPLRYSGGMVNGGIYVLEPEIFDFIPQNIKCSLEFDVYPRVLKSSYRLLAYHYDGFFGDIGTPTGYHRVEHYIKSTNLILETSSYDK